GLLRLLHEAFKFLGEYLLLANTFDDAFLLSFIKLGEPLPNASQNHRTTASEANPGGPTNPSPSSSPNISQPRTATRIILLIIIILVTFAGLISLLILAAVAPNWLGAGNLVVMNTATSGIWFPTGEFQTLWPDYQLFLKVYESRPAEY